MKISNDALNEIIVRHGEKLLTYYAKEYQERPKELIGSFLKYDSIKMAACIVVFTCRKNGILKELEGKKRF